ncbi:unnamed protein product, partial [Urochloa humidicola]
AGLCAEDLGEAKFDPGTFYCFGGPFGTKSTASFWSCRGLCLSSTREGDKDNR